MKKVSLTLVYSTTRDHQRLGKIFLAHFCLLHLSTLELYIISYSLQGSNNFKYNYRSPKTYGLQKGFIGQIQFYWLEKKKTFKAVKENLASTNRSIIQGNKNSPPTFIILQMTWMRDLLKSVCQTCNLIADESRKLSI